MAITVTGVVAKLRTAEGQKMFRYTMASVVAVCVSTLCFLIFDGLIGLHAVVSSALATTIAAVPSYEMNRKWAWGKSGRGHLWKEVVPFWALALLGWGVSTISVYFMEAYAKHHHFSHVLSTFTVAAVYVGAFGVLWVGKFIIFNKVLFVHHPEDLPVRAGRSDRPSRVVQPELLAHARAAKGFMPDDEGAALYQAGRVAAGTGLGPLLEVGTYCGKSAVYLGAAARDGGTVLVSVDHHRGSEENQAGWEHHDTAVVDPRTGRMDTLPFARRAVEDAGLEGHVVLVVGASETVAAVWAAPLALLFIDGGHAPDVAWADYRAWTPKVAGGGFLAIHDVFPDAADGGRPPYELYCAALATGEWADQEVMTCGSLRVLRRLGSAGPAR